MFVAGVYASNVETQVVAKASDTGKKTILDPAVFATKWAMHDEQTENDPEKNRPTHLLKALKRTILDPAIANKWRVHEQ